MLPLNGSLPNILTFEILLLLLLSISPLIVATFSSAPTAIFPTCKREKGYMGDAVFNEAFKYISPDQDSYFSMHGLGEPLLLIH